jgi:integrase
MASLRKHPRSPFWFACLTLSDGRRTNRSTGTDDKRLAQRIAAQYEDAERDGGAGRLTEARARKTIAEIYARTNAATLPTSTVGDFLDSWLRVRELEVAAKTISTYATAVAQFKHHLGPKVRREVSAITASDFSEFRAALVQRVASGTVNLTLTIIRGAFAQAKRDGLVDANPAERVGPIKSRGDRLERRPFTLPELRRILAAADEEWRGIILFGIYTGARLGDIANLTWQSVDIQRAEARFVTSKTTRRMVIPMAPPLLRFVESMPSSDDPTAPVFSRANAIVSRQEGRVGTLSNQFHALLAAAGLVEPRGRKGTGGQGRSGKRTQNDVSFHCLRHTATSLLKSAGVSEAVAMEFIGHDSASISRNYTHVAPEAMRSAANQMPDITQGVK